MGALIGGLLAEFWQYIAGGVGVIVALFVARRSGVKAEQAKQTKATLERRESIDEAMHGVGGADAWRSGLRNRKK